jgi:ankyrin repeat protein
VDVLRLLVGREGLELDARDPHGRTAFALACAGGHVEAVRYLGSEAGADVNTHDMDLLTPLMLAVANHRVEVAALLCDLGVSKVGLSLRGPKQETALHMAAARGLLTAVRGLVLAGADAQARDVMGRAPIFQAVAAGHTPVVSFLLKAMGLGLGVEDPEMMQRLLDFAAEVGREDIARYLYRRAREAEEVQLRLRPTAQPWTVSVSLWWGLEWLEVVL